MKLLSLFSGIGAFEKAGLNDPPFLVIHSTCCEECFKEMYMVQTPVDDDEYWM